MSRLVLVALAACVVYPLPAADPKPAPNFVLTDSAGKKWALHEQKAKATVVATNLRGPEVPLRFAGQTIERLIVWAPQSGRLGLGVSLLSYAGRLTVAVASDEGILREPEIFSASFARELDALERDLLEADLLQAERAVEGAEPRSEVRRSG